MSDRAVAELVFLTVPPIAAADAKVAGVLFGRASDLQLKQRALSANSSHFAQMRAGIWRADRMERPEPWRRQPPGALATAQRTIQTSVDDVMWYRGRASRTSRYGAAKTERTALPAWRRSSHFCLAGWE
jgi:hypothetical protein